MVTFDEDGNIDYAPDCESPKLDELMNVLTELQDEPMLVLTHSKKFAKVAAGRINKEHFGGKRLAVSWTGDTSMKDRAQIEQDFEAGTVKVIVGVIAAMGTGVSSLARVTSTCVWLSRSEDMVDNLQAQGRLDRLDSIGRVTNIEIHSEGTYDEGILDKGLLKAIEMNKSLGAS
jgi:hypothetical protein